MTRTRSTRSGRQTTGITKTVTRSAPVRVSDIKAQPDRVIVQPAGKASRRDRNRSASSVSVAVSNDSVSLSASTRDTSGRGGHRPRNRDKSATIVINNNNFCVQGKPSRHRPRPHLPRRLYHDVRYVHSDPYWYNHGSYFSFRWSGSSCGVALYLPFSSTYYRSGYYHRRYHGSRYGMSYYYPRYHRKYVFVSLGGYWPCDYRHRRYYWYGCHPHYWYGSRVVQPVNYNTYNYYGSNSSSSYAYGLSGSAQPYYTLGSSTTEVIDEPQFQTPADLTFDNAVQLFEAGNYADASEQFREAILLSPDDVVLPFTYAQALFAAGDYARAASVLRSGLSQIPDDELTIYYPRGLYAEDDALVSQIETLQEAISREPFAADYQLLLGYQYLGMGQLDKATVYLPRAAADMANRPAAEKLIALAEQLKEEAGEQ